MYQTEFKDWELVPKETYEIIFSQAKENFEEVASESESITNKSTYLLAGKKRWP